MSKKGVIIFEMEIVISVIAMAIVMIFFYINVKVLINRAYDVKRLNDTNTISQAISLYTVHKSCIPTEININESEISDITGKCLNICGKGVGCINLLKSILPYLEIKNIYSLEGYSVRQSKGGMVTVKSCISKAGETIEVTR